MNLKPNRPSNLHRRESCPGSARMEAPWGDASSTDAEEGQLMHRLVHLPADQWPADLAGEQRDALGRAARLYRQFLDSLPLPRDVVPLRYRERALSDDLLTGTPDEVLVYEAEAGERSSFFHRTAVITDWKFGRIEVEEAAHNLQLAAYATLVCSNHSDVGVVYAAIIQPRAPLEQRITSAMYNIPALNRARMAIAAIIARTNAEDAPLEASEDACRYCRAQAVCPEFQRWITAPAKLLPGTLEKKDAPLAMASLSIDQLTAVGIAIKFADMIKDAWTAEILARIEKGTAPGWGLRNTGSVRKLKSVLTAYEILRAEFSGHAKYSENGSFAEDFMACMKVGWEDLEALIRTLTGATSDAKAKAALDGLFGDQIEKVEKAKSPILLK